LKIIEKLIERENALIRIVMVGILRGGEKGGKGGKGLN